MGRGAAVPLSRTKPRTVSGQTMSTFPGISNQSTSPEVPNQHIQCRTALQPSPAPPPPPTLCPSFVKTFATFGAIGFCMEIFWKISQNFQNLFHKNCKMFSENFKNNCQKIQENFQKSAVDCDKAPPPLYCGWGGLIQGTLNHRPRGFLRLMGLSVPISAQGIAQ